MSGFDVVFGSGEPDPLDPAHVAWSYAQFHMLKIGGIWGVPRSGLVFTRVDETTLALTSRMSWMPEMEGTITEEELEIGRAHV